MKKKEKCCDKDNYWVLTFRLDLTPSLFRKDFVNCTISRLCIHFSRIFPQGPSTLSYTFRRHHPFFVLYYSLIFCRPHRSCLTLSLLPLYSDLSRYNDCCVPEHQVQVLKLETDFRYPSVTCHS